MNTIINIQYTNYNESELVASKAQADQLTAITKQADYVGYTIEVAGDWELECTMAMSGDVSIARIYAKARAIGQAELEEGYEGCLSLWDYLTPAEQDYMEGCWDIDSITNPKARTEIKALCDTPVAWNETLTWKHVKEENENMVMHRAIGEITMYLGDRMNVTCFKMYGFND